MLFCDFGGLILQVQMKWPMHIMPNMWVEELIWAVPIDSGCFPHLYLEQSYKKQMDECANLQEVRFGFTTTVWTSAVNNPKSKHTLWLCALLHEIKCFLTQYLTKYLSSSWFCLLFYPFQLRNMSVQDGSVWTKVWWMLPGVLPLQQHRLPALPVSQPHQLLPSTVWWVCWGHRNVGGSLNYFAYLEFKTIVCHALVNLLSTILSKYMTFSKT